MKSKKIYIKDTGGTQYQCELDGDTTIGNIALDFFETMEWPQQDAHGRGQRAAVEYYDEKKKKYIRLRVDQTLAEANIPDGATLSIYPESIAGAIDDRRRLAALKIDHAEMKKLVQDYPEISFIANKEDCPDDYEIEFKLPSFSSAPIHEGDKPEMSDLHRVSIHLGAEYPREAPSLHWDTPLFHPNVSMEGHVCLGQLKERYLPNLGLKRIVILLHEMVHWRNYDFFEPFNQEAANWAAEPDNWDTIEEMGGHRFDIPYKELINPDNWGDTTKEDAFFKGKDQPAYLKYQWAMYQKRPRIQFNSLHNFQENGQ